MRGRLQMSEAERRRLGPLGRVVKKEITLAAAALQMAISYRQALRVLKRYREEEDAGLIHKACGRASPRRTDPAFKEAVLELCRSKYADFGPTLASEKLLERDDKPVNRETLRRWLIEAGCRQPRQAKARHRTWRKRKACFGEMLQMDGSPHAWFEERGPNCFLMNLVDDATGTAKALFSEEETTWAAMDLLERWVRRFGIPVCIYVDRKSVYVTDREQTPAEQLAAMPALTQFGRACHKLGVRIIEAHSPQAKGRVERKHGLFQDRLIKELRLENVSEIEPANRFLPAWLDKNNVQFGVAPRSDVDMHRPVPRDMDLGRVFCLEEERSLGMDFTLRYKNRWMQVCAQKGLPAPRAKITVQEWRDGSLHLAHDGSELTYRPLDERPQRPKAEALPDRPRPVTIPAEEHPWRRGRKLDTDYIDPRQLPELLNQLADTYLGAPRLAP
jgi:hypothetical protein